MNPSFSKGNAVNYNYSWDLVQANHVTHGNAKANVPLDQQYACGSNSDRISYAQNEIVCFRLDNSVQQLVVAPVMTDLNAAGGGNDYAKCPKGNLDITGQYFIWTSNAGSSRQEAFIVKVPAHLLFGQPKAGSATISASSTSVQPGASVSVTVSNGPGSTTDWVGNSRFNCTERQSPSCLMEVSQWCSIATFKRANDGCSHICHASYGRYLSVSVLP